MFSGSNNRSPQYGSMGPGGKRPHKNFFGQHSHYQQPQVMYMAGGDVRLYSQMPHEFIEPQVLPNAKPCRMMRGFAGAYNPYAHHSGPNMQNQHYQYQPHQFHSPQHIHYVHPQPYTRESVPSVPSYTPPCAPPTSGFIDGIKNMVKGIITPLNCDFYSDHHKSYNPKFRNNYLRDIASTDKMTYTPKQPEPHLQTVLIGLDVRMSAAAAAPSVPKACESAAVPQKSPPTTAEVVAIFTSEDFPELPVPRGNRSVTPVKTEKTPERSVQPSKEAAAHKEPSPAPQQPASTSPPPSPATHPTPKATYFEIMCTKKPSGRRPCFGGRMKVVPPPFSLNASHRTCRGRSDSKPHEDCDIDEDGFVNIPKWRTEDCVFAPLQTTCRFPRTRQLSECSEDDFIQFTAEDGVPTFECYESDELTDDEDEDDDDEDDDDDDDDDEDDDDDSDDSQLYNEHSDGSGDELDNGTDEIDSSFMGRDKTDRNKCAGTTMVVYPNDNKLFDSDFDEKKVTFNLNPKVHVMHAWKFAYRAARKGHWEDFARDRTRFQKRIERTSVYLNPILTPEHREKIYRSRFCEEPEEATAPSEERPPQSQTDQTRSPSSPEPAVVLTDKNQTIPKWSNSSPQCARF